MQMATKKKLGSKQGASGSEAGGGGKSPSLNPNQPSYFSHESIKIIGESIGISSSLLADKGAKLICDQVLFRVKQIIQESIKFGGHAKRTRLACADIDSSLRILNCEPLYGFTTEEGLPFRYASGGGRELYFNEDKEVDLQDVINAISVSKLPVDVSLKCHLLSIDGTQPSIPENPPLVSKEDQKEESINPIKKKRVDAGNKSRGGKSSFSEMVKIKGYAIHELSVEQQYYYKEITEACVGSDETKRGEALHSLTFDPGLHQMLPRLCTFISEGVKVNVVQNNLALLIYLMRMVKAILDNSSLYLEKYLHELIPTCITCIVSKQLCMRPDIDNHWALRDFASRLLYQITKTFNTNINLIQIRITRLLSRALDNDKLALSSQYGAISALCEFGPEVQRSMLFKRIKFIGERIRVYLEAGNTNLTNNAEKSAAEHISNLLKRVIPMTIKNVKNSQESLENFKNEFGTYFGPHFYLSVSRLRNSSTTATINSSSGSTTITTIQAQPSLQPQGQAPQQKYIILPSSSQMGFKKIIPHSNQKVFIMPSSNPNTAQQIQKM